MIFTIIGNRDAPEYERVKYLPVVRSLLLAGHTGRSGGAEGMDAVLTEVVEELLKEGHSEIKAEIYLPKAYFKGLADGDLEGRVTSVLEYANREEANKLASEVHPAWHYCDDYSRGAHIRNMYEVLGKELDTPSDFVLTFAKTTRKEVILGGTATAAELAIKHEIPIFNGYIKPFEEIYEFLKERGIEDDMDHRE